MLMWPWYTLAEEHDSGIYKIEMFANYFPEGAEIGITLAILKSCRGYLNVAVPISELGTRRYPSVSREDAAKEVGPEELKDFLHSWDNEDV